ncbi:hypothetical protein [Eubacterium barkeri]|uniref:Uncharacterized protein n=1 Tax=Eubacterium barkeri TaxID=1528 RepID=A0A1H3BI99_EUBBA|nr:hypothetical protein [Eubacterium barkeri]SDX41637.1 hypothetical protein SAMN04488579_10290 [Eubacterium barkeri]
MNKEKELTIIVKSENTNISIEEMASSLEQCCKEIGMSCQVIEERCQENNTVKIFGNAIEKYGIEAQSDVAIEEMAELIQAIVKFRRYGKSENATEYLDEVIEEKEDVKIMMDQLDLIYGDSREMRDWKVNRLSRRLEDQSE